MCGFLQLQFDKIPKSVALLTAVLKLNHSLENLQFVCQSELLLLLLTTGMNSPFPVASGVSKSSGGNEMFTPHAI